MYRAFRRSAFAAFAVLFSVALFAQQSKTQLPVAAPIPAQITAAAKVFISNRGGDRTETLGEAEFDGGPDRPYNAFYAAMKSWGTTNLSHRQQLPI